MKNLNQSRLTPEYIQSVLPKVGNGQNLSHWSHTLPSDKLRQAAVLIPLLQNYSSQPRLLLTERAAHLKNHAGEISFPGGAYESDDVELLTTAMRETYEETGISPEFIQPLGVLGDLDTVSGFRLRAYIGWVRTGYELKAQTSEVASLINTDASYALTTSHYHWQTRITKAGKFELPEIQLETHRVWGVTGILLWELSQKLCN